MYQMLFSTFLVTFTHYKLYLFMNNNIIINADDNKWPKITKCKIIIIPVLRPNCNIIIIITVVAKLPITTF